MSTDFNISGIPMDEETRTHALHAIVALALIDADHDVIEQAADLVDGWQVRGAIPTNAANVAIRMVETIKERYAVAESVEYVLGFACDVLSDAFADLSGKIIGLKQERDELTRRLADANAAA